MSKSPQNQKRQPDLHSPKVSSFWDYVLDMYDSPSQISKTPIKNGREGMMQDRDQIRSYFNIAEKQFGT